MWKTKMALGVGNWFGADAKTLIKAFRNAGFDGFFVEWNKDINLTDLKAYGTELGMTFQSVHAPYIKSADMWQEGEKAEAAVAELIRCVEETAAPGIPLLVCHCWIGFGDCVPTEVGIENYRRVVERASGLGLKIAFENTEGDPALHALMEAFQDEPNVGFCWDTGHEMCYNHSQDLLALYGDRLFGTHINDNLGIRDYDGATTYLDDLHLLPFDGIADWADIADRLNKYHFSEMLTFELTPNSKPGRHENDGYREMGLERFLAEAYKRACRVAVLYRAAEQKYLAQEGPAAEIKEEPNDEHEQ